MASTDDAVTNVITFPSRSIPPRSPNMSIASTRATALDVCYSVYGETPVSADAVVNFYEANASKFSIFHKRSIGLTSMVTLVYENPFVTATSRSIIGDIHKLSRQLSSVDIPRPLAMLCTLFQLRAPRSADFPFQILRAWTDVHDVCENESFDGHRKAIVEHALNILLLPGIHCEGPTSHRASSSSESLVNVHGSPLLPSISQPFVSPSLPIPGTSLSFPSPLHFQLRIVTRLSFNEQGLITHHRDIWDIKDVIGLLPGMSLAQWIGTRITGTGLSYLSRLLPAKSNESLSEHPSRSLDAEDLEQGDRHWSTKHAKLPSEKLVAQQICS